MKDQDNLPVSAPAAGDWTVEEERSESQELIDDNNESSLII